MKAILVDGEKIRLQIWDTAGAERFRAIHPIYYRGSHGVIITYDITNRDSFADISKWLCEVNKHLDKNIPCILVGNKKDLEDRRQI